MNKIKIGLFQKIKMHRNAKTILKKNTKCSHDLPWDVKDAIKAFMRFGDKTLNVSHNGYYSDGGWPYNTLEKFLNLSTTDVTSSNKETNKNEA